MTTKTKTSRNVARKAAKKTAKKSTVKARHARKAAPRVNTEDVLGEAMLVNVNIKMWEGRKHDREVTERVHSEFHAAAGSGRYHKHLFGGKVPELSRIITAAATLRGIHYTQTLPWADTGWRLLPTANYTAYTDAMREAIASFNNASDGLARRYTDMIEEAETRLNGMFRAADYPPASSIRARYKVAIEFAPLPAGSDFRVNLPKAELARVAAEVEERVAQSIELAMAETWERLGDAVTTLREKLDDGKYLRESMLERLRDVAETLGRLNLTKDKALEKTRTAVLEQLGKFDAETLKEDEGARKEAAKAADAILSTMVGVYGGGQA